MSRKFIDPMPAGGAPIYTQELNAALTREIYLGFQSMMNALTDIIAGIIVSGGAVSNNGDGTYNIGSGVAFFQSDVAADDGGDFMEFDAATNLTLPFYINQSTPITEQIEFADAATKDYIVNKRAEVSQSASGATIIINSFPAGDHIYLETFVVNTFALQSVVDSLNSLTTQLSSHEALTATAHFDHRSPRFIATIDSDGTILKQYNRNNNGVVFNNSSTGQYDITVDGIALDTVWPNNAVIVTSHLQVSTTNGTFSNYNSSSIYLNSEGGTLLNAKFNIVIYDL